jgi:RNA 3'-phosphate cyclase
MGYEMIEIDGSYGEGGGQTLRTAIAFSILTQTPVRITQIRANRPQPGLKPQHLTVLKILSGLSKAKTEGLIKGSSTVFFHPSILCGGTYRFDVGTAGSVVLIAQTILLATLRAKERIIIELTGGTDVKWAPSWDYFIHVFLPLVKQMGLNVEVFLERRGYYPKGGGRIRLIVPPQSVLAPLILNNPLPVNVITGSIHSYGLPDHIKMRLKQSIQKTAVHKGYKSQVRTETDQTNSPGVVLTLWADTKNRFLGCVGLGERGKRAEAIATESVNTLDEYIKSDSTVDPYLFDQILGFLICANGHSRIITPHLSSHAQTNIWLISQFFHDNTYVKYTDDTHHINVDVSGQNFW